MTTTGPTREDQTTTGPSIVVRPAQLEDVDEIVVIGVRSWKEGYRGVVPQGLVPDAAGLRTRIRERIAERVPAIPVGVFYGVVPA